jgi:hypothetical protein
VATIGYPGPYEPGGYPPHRPPAYGEPEPALVAPGPAPAPADTERSGRNWLVVVSLIVAAVALLGSAVFGALLIAAESHDAPTGNAGGGTTSVSAGPASETPTPEPSTESSSPAPSEASSSVKPSSTKTPVTSTAPAVTSKNISDLSGACKEFWGVTKVFYPIASANGVLCLLGGTQAVYGKDLEMDKYCWDYFQVPTATIADDKLNWYCGDPVNTVDMDHKCQVSYPNRSETAAKPRDLRPNPDDPPAHHWGCNVMNTRELTQTKLGEYCTRKYGHLGLTRALPRDPKDPRSWTCAFP